MVHTAILMNMHSYTQVILQYRSWISIEGDHVYMHSRGYSNFNLLLITVLHLCSNSYRNHTITHYKQFSGRVATPTSFVVQCPKYSHPIL